MILRKVAALKPGVTLILEGKPFVLSKIERVKNVYEIEAYNLDQGRDERGYRLEVDDLVEGIVVMTKHTLQHWSQGFARGGK